MLTSSVQTTGMVSGLNWACRSFIRVSCRMHLVPIKQRVDKQHIERLLEADERNTRSSAPDADAESVHSVLAEIASEAGTAASAQER